MRLSPLVAACAVSLPLLSGTADANAYPIKDRVLTHNKLYRAGKLKPAACMVKVMNQHFDPPVSKTYGRAVLDCLNAAWAAYAKRARLPFAKARVAFATKEPRRFCGSSWPDRAGGVYCPSERRFMMLVSEVSIDEPWGLHFLSTLTHEYGHHIQQISGIIRADQYHPYRGKSELNEQAHRLELQAECLSGVLFKSMWPALNSSETEWESLVDRTRAGAEYLERTYKTNTHGKGRNLEYWLRRGFQTGNPASCNTWVAPSAKVA
ncbi:neutral zinc metallopeptidase [Acrocarpospora catenulata]|uniref:neutral zinc metallopeptidase n=1 Tax=Acrocarpospora catenulata TaxID=2836182 RepID=UPI001BD95941|nr:neutral zinc metallopeptidase [Acrocarpospora catenulata]